MWITLKNRVDNLPFKRKRKRKRKIFIYKIKKIPKKEKKRLTFEKNYPYSIT